MTIDGDEPGEPAEPAPTEPPTAEDATRRPLAIIIAGGAAFLVLLTMIVVLATRGSTITTTVSAAEAIPGETTTTVNANAGNDAGPVETAPETLPPAEDSTTVTTAAPADDAPDVSISVPRPSTVLTGKTTGQIPVYAAPGGGGVKVTLPNPRAVNSDAGAPTVPLVLLAKQQQGDWFEAWIPIRPNGATGWVRGSDFTTSTHDYRIEVHLNKFNLKVFNGDNLIMNTGIGVATASSPTPGGLYYTIELLAPPDPNGPYGPYAYGLSGYSNTYTSFGGGPGQLGLHGTNQPGAIGQRVSHGCIRLRNQDITTLAKTLPLGVPVLVYRN